MGLSRPKQNAPYFSCERRLSKPELTDPEPSHVTAASLRRVGLTLRMFGVGKKSTARTARMFAPSP